MEQYAIVYFPHIDIEKINAIREKYDSHWNVIPAHITLISPFSYIPEQQIFEHLETATKDLKPFQVHLHGFKKTDDHLLFLLMKEGRDEIIEIHNQLHSGILSSLKQEYIFDPHITLGEVSTEPEVDIDTHSVFDNITLIKGDGISPAKIIKTFNLQ